MFQSKMRDIVITQYEHGRLSGILASLWGNDQFDRPPFDFEAFVTGVTFHDWGYQQLDTLPINGVPEEEWEAVARRGMEYRFEDPVVDIIKTMHVRRLLGYNPTPSRAAMMAEATEIIEKRLADTPHTRAEFEWSDRITRFCDNIAFSFSFEEPTTATYAVYPRQSDLQTEVELTYQIRPDGEITVSPWPFSQPDYTGFITGYQAEGYPTALTPLLIPFSLHPS